MLDKLKQYKKDSGTARLPKVYKRNTGEEYDEELHELCKWQLSQITLYRRDELDSQRKKRLRKIGMCLTKGHMGKVEWKDRFEEMMEYYHTHKTCLPRRNGEYSSTIYHLQSRYCCSDLIMVQKLT